MPPTANIVRLEKMARHLRPLLDEVVFLGGCTTEIFVTDAGAAEVRPTTDVDVVIEVASLVQYCDFAERLRKIGFQEDSSDGAPRCRWLIDGAQLDVMPTHEEILGFSNPWYEAAMEAAQEYVLGADLTIRTITAPYFIATKLVAFRNRGNNDYQASSDLEDIIAVLDGRAAIVAEIRTQNDRIQSYLAKEMASLLGTAGFSDALPGYVEQDPVSQARVRVIEDRIRQIAQMQ
jgi:predicted nucleotidyltransferase